METYKTTIAGGSHWSLVIRRGVQMTLRDLQGGANVGMLFFNPTMLTEKYNAPDTLKCQHTFKLSKGNCLYSDMGRIFCSVVDDSFGWHESVCGNSHATLVEERWGKRDYQKDSNAWHQNGYDAFLVELTKYNLSARDMASNINWFSCVRADDKGNLILANQSKAGDEVVLRFEMDTLVLLHTCPHPLNISTAYPEKPVDILLEKAAPIENDDFCKNFRPENQRGFENNALYHFGMESQ
ncbi:urea amidolyase associated protein UAAP1 [Aurantivibrio plasticivorans]